MTPTASAATTLRPASSTRLLNKVPEVTAWFWIIKILCTTVGESFADWINETLGFGLMNTMLLFTAVLAVALIAQLRARRYIPALYWTAVVVVSVAGTLYTDMGTDQIGIPLWVSSTVFGVLLAAVFLIWWIRERTLSIHSIDTRPRELFYWLTVLVTFALGTALGDWTLELTAWQPGTAVLLPAALIAAIAILWRLGADPVLCFWVAYVLTRPLGANIGDWLASPQTAANPGDPVGLGLGTMWTSLLFLGAILAVVVYLTVSRRDVVEEQGALGRSRGHRASAAGSALAPMRRSLGLAGVAAVMLGGVAVLSWAHLQPHQTCDPTGQSETLAACPAQALSAQQAHEKNARYVELAQSAITQDQAGKASASHDTVQKMRDAWDADAASLQGVDKTKWTTLDEQMDAVLGTYAIDHPGTSAAPASQQEKELRTLLQDLQHNGF